MTSPGATKKCWSCDATTHYDTGWCDSCQASFPPEVLRVLEACETMPDSDYRGAIRGAVAQTLTVRQVRLKRDPRPKPTAARLTLDDLDL